MEGEQRELFEYEIALLQRLDGAAGSHGAEVDFRPATKRVAAVRLADTNEMQFKKWANRKRRWIMALARVASWQVGDFNAQQLANSA